MSSLNKAQIIGRLGADPEVRYTQSNIAVANMGVATTEKYKDRSTGENIENTEWHRVVVWGRLAEVCQEYLRKGSLVFFEGPLQTRRWDDKDGITRYSTEIKAREMVMLETKGGGGRDPDSGGYAGSAQQAQSKAQVQDGPGTRGVGSTGASTKNTGNMDLTDVDDDLPFGWLFIIGASTVVQLFINSSLV